MVSILVIVLNVVKLTALPIARCPSVTPPAIRMHTACANTGSATMLGSIVTPLRSRVGNIRGVVCVRSSTSGGNTTSVGICFGRKASPSVTTIGIRGHISVTRKLLPTRMAGINIAARGHRGSVLVIFSLCSRASSCGVRFVRGCTGVGLVPRVGHMGKMNSTGILKRSCSVHV